MVSTVLSDYITMFKIQKKKKMISNKNILILSFFLFVFLGVGCHRNTKVPETMLSGTIKIVADEDLAPLVKSQLDVFQGIYRYASVKCSYGTEVEAMDSIIKGKTYMALITRPLSQKELDYFKSKDFFPQSFPIAYDGVAVIVNPQNKLNIITTQQITQILSGKITNWSQFEGSGRSESIKLILDSESSGIIRSLNDSLHLNQKISGDYVFAGNSKNVIERIASEPNGIGFVGYSLLSELESPKVQETLNTIHVLGVSAAAVADSTNTFKPSLWSLYEKCYPLTRKIYAIYTDPTSSGLTKGFLSHLTSDRGQLLIYRMGLRPEKDFQRLIKIKNDF